MNVSSVDGLGASFSEPPLPDMEDVWEVPLLLESAHVSALIEAAGQQDLAAGALARRVIEEYLRPRRTA